MKITFLGATQEVTGSKYLINHNDTTVLIDCGLFQGGKEMTRQNWNKFPISPSQVDAIVLTHAHIDHTGYIPALVKNGFRGPIYCSQATYRMCTILLIDSGTLQEEEAKNHHNTPLYTKQDAEFALTFFKPINYDDAVQIKSLKVTLIRSGHILGSAFVVVSDGKKNLTFSGDLGRPYQPILKAPPYLKETDFLVLESTYGNRIHEQDDPEKVLGNVINDTVKNGGVILIPCFSVMRTQLILYYLYQLKQRNELPNIPIFLDSPSAISITNFFCDFSDEYTLSPGTCTAALSIATKTPDIQDSKKINQLDTSAIIIAGSGMADGGRMPFHLQHYISDPKNTVLFVGYQAKDSRGRALVEGTKELYVYDKVVPVLATIKTIHSLSAHADAQEILAWLGHFEKKPTTVFLTHGEAESMTALKKRIEEELKWHVVIPNYLESFELN